jgi:DNA-binding transcriptional ArsR family regulator
MTIKRGEITTVTARTGNEVDLSKQLGELLRSPVRVKALIVLLERTASPKEISAELKVNLNTASNHVRELLKMGLIELVRTEPRRGAVEHFYRAVMQPVWNEEQWAALSVKERQEYVTWVVQLVNCDVAEALLAGTFNKRPDTHNSRSHLLVDEQGRRELKEIQDDALEASRAVEVASAKRLEKKRSEVFPLNVVMLSIDLPHPLKAGVRP